MRLAFVGFFLLIDLVLHQSPFTNQSPITNHQSIINHQSSPITDD